MYESKVYIRCEESLFNKIEKDIREIGPDRISRNSAGDYLIEFDSWVDWSERHPEEHRIMNALREAQNDVTKGFFGYLRIGEEMEDCSTFYNDDEYSLYYQRSLYRDETIQNFVNLA